ncbi:hypothetical protein BJV77DRAFT_1092729 [Russula vinacea]|nr:hypothetical protein BJV77DRAFT_1092729 [Russula vinacea]
MSPIQKHVRQPSEEVLPFKSALATSQPTQQLSPPQLLPSTPESQSYSSQQQQQAQPNHPWSVLRPTSRSNDVPIHVAIAFSRFGHTLSITAAGDLLFFGGSLRNFLKTSGEVPSPRYYSASFLLVSIARVDSRHGQWSQARGRSAVPMTMVGSKLSSSAVDREWALNDMWAFDVNSLNSNPVWDSYEPAPGDEKPPPRFGHVLVTTGDRIILKWTELRCTGCVPSPRYSHTASLVDDVIRLDDLIASSCRQWFTMQIWDQVQADDRVMPWFLTGHGSSCLEGIRSGHSGG